MTEINEKIQELLLVSKLPIKGWSGLEKKMKQQDKLMDELKELARTNSTPLGRIIKFQMADSYAYYIISHLAKQKVVVNWIDYCDGWIDDRLGKVGTLDYSYVQNEIKREDYLDDLFIKQKIKVESNVQNI